jgi:CO/xanthine dehydrogenase FAD-binding subunit
VNSISFIKPASIEQAVAALKVQGYMAVAGGTDLIVKIRNGLFPDLKGVVDISALPLREITTCGNDLLIGSGCTMSQIIANPMVNKHCAVLVKAASTVGAMQIRNAATLGGNVANASPAGDTIPALLALEARLNLVGPNGRRTVNIETFFTGPGRTIMTAGELIESFALPLRRTSGCFLKLGERRAHAISKINMAVNFWNDGHNNFRIRQGSVAPTVLRCQKAEELLEKASLPLSEAIINQAAELAVETARPISDVRSTQSYRKKMAGVLLKRAIVSILNNQ